MFLCLIVGEGVWEGIHHTDQQISRPPPSYDWRKSFLANNSDHNQVGPTHETKMLAFLQKFLLFKRDEKHQKDSFWVLCRNADTNAATYLVSPSCVKYFNKDNITSTLLLVQNAPPAPAHHHAAPPRLKNLLADPRSVNEARSRRSETKANRACLHVRTNGVLCADLDECLPCASDGESCSAQQCESVGAVYG